ncbi:MAG TPA: HEAT repeat domain-containing protein [Desulfarculaceae bacterium]|nr:HEAT repeat domain-containing protein [Desulfarculaceae bacterium]
MMKYYSQGKEPVEDLLTLVRQILIALNGAFKKLLLYPSEHVIYQTSLNSLKDSLSNFIDQHGDLVFNIDRHKILYRDEVVIEGSMDEENLAFILFRDGIYHLEFHQSIALWEINSFLEILQKYQVLTDDSENDVVTALWEVDLPCLSYKAEDVGFDTGEDFEIPESGVDESSQDDPGLEAEDIDNTPLDLSFQTPIQNRLLWKITSEDQEYLRKMLAEENDRERIEYVLYILLYILQQQTQPDDFSEVMAFLNQELQDAILEHKYQSVYKTLQILKKNIDLHKATEHWSIPILKEFFASVSSKMFLTVMQDDWPKIAECTPEELIYLKQALIMLNPEAIEALGPMLLETTSNQTKKLLMEVIGVLAERKFDHLNKLLSSTHYELLKILINVIKFMKSKESFQCLPELLRHESADVRKEALKAIYHRNSKMISELGLLLEDPDEVVQQLFLIYAGQQRDLKTEKLLLDYLKSHRIRDGNKQLLFRVYISLGKCGSDESLPFLKKNLFFLFRFRILRSKRSLRRQAAEYALKEINTDKAKLMLNESSKR